MFMHKIFVYKLYLWYPFQFHNGKEKNTQNVVSHPYLI